jgi:hypothetical protein
MFFLLTPEVLDAELVVRTSGLTREAVRALPAVARAYPPRAETDLTSWLAWCAGVDVGRPPITWPAAVRSGLRRRRRGLLEWWRLRPCRPRSAIRGWCPR